MPALSLPERYQLHLSNYRFLGMTPLSYDMWLLAMKPRLTPRQSDVEFDYAKEREGDAQ